MHFTLCLYQSNIRLLGRKKDDDYVSDRKVLGKKFYLNIFPRKNVDENYEFAATVTWALLSSNAHTPMT